MVQRDHGGDGVATLGAPEPRRPVAPLLEEFWPGRRADDFDEFCPA